MKLHSQKYTYLAIAIFCLASLVFAWVAEIYFGIKPCPLCVYVRYFYGAVCICSMFLFFYQAYLLKILNILAVTAALSLSFFHVGVEQHWWKGPAFCSSAGIDTTKMRDLSAEEKIKRLKNKLMASKSVRCDQVNWRILGVSATIWNTLLLAGLLLILRRQGWKKRTFTR